MNIDIFFVKVLELLPQAFKLYGLFVAYLLHKCETLRFNRCGLQAMHPAYTGNKLQPSSSALNIDRNLAIIHEFTGLCKFILSVCSKIVFEIDSVSF